MPDAVSVVAESKQARIRRRANALTHSPAFPRVSPAFPPRFALLRVMLAGTPYPSDLPLTHRPCDQRHETRPRGGQEPISSIATAARRPNLLSQHLEGEGLPKVRGGGQPHPPCNAATILFELHPLQGARSGRSSRFRTDGRESLQGRHADACGPGSGRRTQGIRPPCRPSESPTSADTRTGSHRSTCPVQSGSTSHSGQGVSRPPRERRP
jgi:hypothetical protein